MVGFKPVHRVAFIQKLNLFELFTAVRYAFFSCMLWPHSNEWEVGSFIWLLMPVITN